MTLYRRGKPAFEEPVHWQWLDELEKAGVLVPVELDYEAAEIAYSNHETSKTIVDAAVGEETP